MPPFAIEAVARIRLLYEPGHGEPSLSRYSIYKISNRHRPENTFRACRRGRRQFFRDGNLTQRHSRVSTIDISKLYLSLKSRVKEARLNLSKNYLESNKNVSFSMTKYFFTYEFHGKFVKKKNQRLKSRLMILF